MMLFISVLIAGFISVGRALRLKENQPEEQFLVWTLGAILFAHAATMVSVSYFDQSIVFLYLVLAAIGSVHAAALAEAKPGDQTGQIESETEVVTAPHYG